LCQAFDFLYVPSVSSTIFCGLTAACVGQPRLNVKEARILLTVLINFCVGIFQLITVTFLLVGWFWSISWGALLVMHSRKCYFFMEHSLFIYNANNMVKQMTDQYRCFGPCLTGFLQGKKLVEFHESFLLSTETRFFRDKRILSIFMC
ncbi:unnamed protein product, partial [Soboliphyme baturini]|uniref:Protein DETOXIFICATION n=1 Tax=Soboliphyme baturini TaxID=241478 RepID=A0A183I923_9BILA